MINPEIYDADGADAEIIRLAGLGVLAVRDIWDWSSSAGAEYTVRVVRVPGVET